MPENGGTVDIKNNWTDYWQKEGAGGEVYVNKDGGKSPVLSNFWREQFSKLGNVKNNNKIIDIASGAGSIFANLPEHHSFTLFAADVSQHALEQLKLRIDNVTTVTCGVDKVPFDNCYFDTVVSQYGMEYAGLNAFNEAARLVAVDGVLIVICHYENGQIDSRNQVELQGAYLAKKLEFIDRAILVSKTSFAAKEHELKQAFDSFIEVEPKLAAYCTKHPSGVHSYLYAGFKQLFTNKQSYTLDDIVGWLEGMRPEVDKSILRLEEMRRAALSLAEMQDIKSRLEQNGLSNVVFVPLVVPGNTVPIAWELRAQRLKEG
jgi:ubiquinone/menaquinone biosynthesis C-methylase UbiE